MNARKGRGAIGKQPVSVDELDAIIATMRKQAGVLARLADAMRAKGAKNVDAMNLPMMSRYEKHANNFILSLKRGLGEI